MIETQRVVESGAPSREVPEDRHARLYARIHELKIDAAQQKNLIDILGPRYDSNKRLLKLTSSKYPNPDENVQNCISMLKSLIQEAKEMTEKLSKATNAV
jgi:hypothetical protein